MPADAARLSALTDEAGWNQTVEDWRFMLEMGSGWGLWDDAGAAVASALVVPYPPRFAWISMVLVAESRRRQGFATRLTQRCLKELEARALVPLLDASQAGQGVYKKLGFGTLWIFDRLVADRPQRIATAKATRIMQESDLSLVARLDADAFGARRDAVLAHCRTRQPASAVVMEDGSGFALARDGRHTSHIGPLVATDAEGATALLCAALDGATGPVSIDVPARQVAFRATLADMGFALQRPFARMSPSPEAFGKPQDRYAVTGPEFG